MNMELKIEKIGDSARMGVAREVTQSRKRAPRALSKQSGGHGVSQA